MKRYICYGCGKSRPCIVSTNQEKWVEDEIDNLKCILDSTNQTSYNWKEL